MRILDGEQTLCRIFIGDADKSHNHPLWRALLERMRKEGIAGFGARSIVHTTNIVDLSTDLPIVIEVVDDAEHIAKLTQILDEMLVGGMVTLEKVRVLRY
ncbi:MAG TPA: DUF190 domain-containing protein [Polyangiales bacterium]|nr:DUF190 domain-containing protein [Polyangiales bacterium]